MLACIRNASGVKLPEKNSKAVHVTGSGWRVSLKKFWRLVDNNSRHPASWIKDLDHPPDNLECQWAQLQAPSHWLPVPLSSQSLQACKLHRWSPSAKLRVGNQGGMFTKILLGFTSKCTTFRWWQCCRAPETWPVNIFLNFYGSNYKWPARTWAAAPSNQLLPKLFSFFSTRRECKFLQEHEELGGAWASTCFLHTPWWWQHGCAPQHAPCRLWNSGGVCYSSAPDAPWWCCRGPGCELSVHFQGSSSSYTSRWDQFQFTWLDMEIIS